MKPYKILLSLTLFAIVFAGVMLAPVVSQAQGPDVIQAEVDRTNLSTDDSLVLTITINASGGKPSQPILPSLPGFYIAGQSSGTSIQVINGAMSSQATYQYRLQPTQVGDLVIDPISVTFDGQTYSTDPITISVTQGTNPTQAQPRRSQPNVPTQVSPNLVGQDFFVEAEVDNPSPYQSEQIVYTFRFYQAANTPGRADYSPPSFTGFWNQQTPEENDYGIQIAGRYYTVTELQYVLFPTLAGEATIEPATLSLPGGFFSRGQRLATEPVVVNVQPLPEGAPASFRGAVGAYDIQAEVDKTETTVGDTVTLTITLTGRGNIDTLPDPVLPQSDQWRSFDSSVTSNTRYEDGYLAGTKTYEWVLVPTEAGQLTIPAIEYSFFDPDSESYQIVSTEAFPVDVAPDETAAPIVPAAGSNPPVDFTPTSTNLRPLKSASGELATASEPLTQRAGYWLLWLVPVALIAGQYTWQKRQQHLHDNAAAIRSQQAARKAKYALQQAHKDQDTANTAAGRILNEYLADKLGYPVTGMTQLELGDALLAHDIDPTLVAGVHKCLARSEYNRYAPPDHATDATDLLAETEQLITDLDKAEWLSPVIR